MSDLYHAAENDIYVFSRRKARPPMTVQYYRYFHRDARHRIDFYGKRECARRPRGQRAQLGEGREVDARLAHRRVSLLGSSGLLPATAWRRLCGWRGVSRDQRAMGCLIRNPRESSAQRSAEGGKRSEQKSDN